MKLPVPDSQLVGKLGDDEQVKGTGKYEPSYFRVRAFSILQTRRPQSLEQAKVKLRLNRYAQLPFPGWYGCLHAASSPLNLASKASAKRPGDEVAPFPHKISP